MIYHEAMLGLQNDLWGSTPNFLRIKWKSNWNMKLKWGLYSLFQKVGLDGEAMLKGSSCASACIVQLNSLTPFFSAEELVVSKVGDPKLDPKIR